MGQTEASIPALLLSIQECYLIPLHLSFPRVAVELKRFIEGFDNVLPATQWHSTYSYYCKLLQELLPVNNNYKPTLGIKISLIGKSSQYDLIQPNCVLVLT